MWSHHWFQPLGMLALPLSLQLQSHLSSPNSDGYLVLASYIVTPVLTFCNSYGCGLTDWSLASTYGKIGLFIVTSIVGTTDGVIAGLAACGAMISIVLTAGDLMQDFKTSYLTYSSTCSLFVAQFIGTALGCVIAPLSFCLYWTEFDIGSPDGVLQGTLCCTLQGDGDPRCGWLFGTPHALPWYFHCILCSGSCHRQCMRSAKKPSTL